jgi:hypothetical protein
MVRLNPTGDAMRKLLVLGLGFAVTLALSVQPVEARSRIAHLWDSPARMFSLPRLGSPDVRRTESRLDLMRQRPFDGAPSPHIVLPPKFGVSIE